MPDNTRTLAQLQTLFADNGVGAISAADLRDYLVSSYQPQFAAPGGRLTTESGVPVSTSDRTSQSTVYYTPYTHDRLGLYDGSGWALWPFAEFAIQLSGLTSGSNYDLFAFATSAAPSSTDTGTDTLTFGSAQGWATGSVVTADADGGGLTAGTYYWYRAATSTTGTLHTTLADALANTSKVNLTASITATLTARSLELSAAWTNDTTRTDALTTLNGVYAKSANTTRRLLGTLRTTGTTTTEDSGGGTASQVGGKRFLWNADNRVPRAMNVTDAGSWSYTTDAWRQANAAAGNKVEFVAGLAGEEAAAALMGGAFIASNTRDARVSVGLDSTTVPAGRRNTAANTGGTGYTFPITAVFRGNVSAGYHYLAWLERGADGTCQFLGADECGLAATIRG